MSFKIHKVEGLTYEQGRRDVVFLESDDNKEIDGLERFQKLKPQRKDDLRGRFDLWKRGEQHHKKYFHGFNEEGYRDCFVFKHKHDRFYGFLYHPRKVTDPRYELCVLVNHAQKYEEHTDPAEMKTVNKFKSERDVMAAIKEAFPEKRG